MSYYSRRRRGNTINGLTKPQDRPNIARQIAAVMAQQRRGREAAEYGKQAGRIDRRRLATVKAGNERVFSTRTAPSATRLKVVVMLDLSGSMSGGNAQRAVQTAWDFILASHSVPTMSLEVWAHTTGYFNREDSDDKPLPEIAAMNKERNGGADEDSGVREGHYVVAYQLYEEGMSKQAFYDQYKSIRMGGNEDGWSLDAVLTDVTHRKHSNERVLLIMVSDGAPIYAEKQMSHGHVRAVVNRWRKRGVGIVSVSVSSSLRKEAQDNMYGASWVVPFDFTFATQHARPVPYWMRDEEVGLSKATVTQMGRLIGRALA